MRLGDAIRTELDGLGMTQAWLARTLGVDPGIVSRIIAGHTKKLTLARVVQIEDALVVPRGALLRAAGYVAEVATPEDAVRQDLSLSRYARETILGAIETGRRLGRAGDHT